MSEGVECFDVNYTTEIIRKIVEDILNTKKFNWKSIDHWNREIIHSCQQSLVAIENSFKFILTTMIIPKNDEYIHMSNACLWDFPLDGSTIIKWENDSMYCVVSVFALSLLCTAQSTTTEIS